MTSKRSSLTALIAAITATVALSACYGPALNTQPLPPAEAAWQEALQEAYPSWTPPKIAPPHTAIPSNELVGDFPVEGQENVILPLKEGESVTIIEDNRSVVPEKPVEAADTALLVPAATVSETPALTPVISPEMPKVTASSKSGLVIKDGTQIKNGKYKVQQGDSLWTIAVKLYGRGSAFKAIIDANPHVNPNKIRPGIELNIPGVVETAVSTPAVVPMTEVIPAVPAKTVQPVAEIVPAAVPAAPKTVVVPAVPVKTDTALVQ